MKKWDLVSYFSHTLSFNDKSMFVKIPVKKIFPKRAHAFSKFKGPEPYLFFELV